MKYLLWSTGQRKGYEYAARAPLFTTICHYQAKEKARRVFLEVHVVNRMLDEKARGNR